MDEKEIEHRLTELEGRARSNTHRLDEQGKRQDDLEKRQDNLDDLVSTVKVLAVREETMENDVKEIKEDVKMLTRKPGKLWDNLTEKIGLTIAAAVVGYILAQIGF